MDAYKNPALSPEERASDLLSRMTLREKIGQLTQRLYGFGIYRREGDEIRFDEDFRAEVERYSGIGTIYGLHRADPWSARDFETGLVGSLAVKARNQLQKYVIDTNTNDTRVGLTVKQTETNTLDISASAAIINLVGLFLYVVIVPIAVLAAGLVVFLRRRHL